MECLLYCYCDIYKSWSTMRFDDKAYSNTVKGRKALVKQIREDYKNKDIESDDIQKLCAMITKGEIDEANVLLDYGYIRRLEML